MVKVMTTMVKTTKLSVSDLKERLKAKGLPVGGKKAELIARLQDGEEE